jgi:choline dehydrogenase
MSLTATTTLLLLLFCWTRCAGGPTTSREASNCTNNESQTAENTYDYIVVGAGASGGLVASRLARAGHRTLLLDAGPRFRDKPITTVPLLWPLSTEDRDIEWRFRSSNSAKDPGRDAVLYPRASTIGGSALHNAMLAMYPFPDFFSNLQKLTGDDEFAESNMRERFQRIEKCEYIQPKNKLLKKGHGFQGFMSTSLADLGLAVKPGFLDPQLVAVVNRFVLTTIPQNPIARFFRSLQKFPKNLPLIFDINAPGANLREGAHLTPSSISPAKGSVRSSVADLIYETEQSTPALTVQDNSFVTHILFDTTEETPVAYGIQVQEGTALYSIATGTRTVGAQKMYFANKEVILAGGTFNTPQILMLSGVGPKQHLAEHNIPLLVDLPGVGENLHDKLEATMNWQMPRTWKLFQQGCTFLKPTPEKDPCFVQFQNGEFPSLYSSSGTLIAIQRKSDPSLSYPDMYLQIVVNKFQGYQDGWVNMTFYEGEEDTLSIHTMNTRSGPGKGIVRLASSSPFDSVEIDFNGYDEIDLEKTARVIEDMRRTFRRLQWLGVVGEEIAPGKNIKSLDDVKAWVRSNGWGHHPMGTAKIGSDDDVMAVVDGQLRVRGVHRLRVVDASVFPHQAGFYPMVPVYMMAEKAADDILRDAKRTISQCGESRPL